MGGEDLFTISTYSAKNFGVTQTSCSRASHLQHGDVPISTRRLGHGLAALEKTSSPFWHPAVSLDLSPFDSTNRDQDFVTAVPRVQLRSL